MSKVDGAEARATRVLYEGSNPDLRDVAARLQDVFGAPPEPEGPRGGAPIALPVGAEAPGGLDRAAVVVALDPESDALAREAGVPRRAVLFPALTVDWSGPLDADLVLVAHEAMVPDAVAAGAAPKRIRTVGPVAPAGWTEALDREEQRAARALRGPVVLVRAEALRRHDLAPSLVQLSLVRAVGTWLFDVGSDAALAEALRRQVPVYGLNAGMFADGPEARGAYAAADVVLAELGSTALLRGLCVGASLVSVAPRRSEAPIAHRLEAEGLVQIADAAATLSVTLDAALAETALAAGQAASRATDPSGGVDRVVAAVEDLLSNKLGDVPPTGLPVGLELLSSEAPESPAPPPSTPKDDLDKQVDDELAALRKKLGL